METFLENLNLPRRIVLMLDNTPCYPDDDECVRESPFLHYSVTSLIQQSKSFGVNEEKLQKIIQKFLLKWLR